MHPTYKFPKLYHDLQALDTDLQKQGFSLDEQFGLRLTGDFPHYHVTPLDLIPFGDIGMDGIHYGFLTDFGTVQNLDDAFIVLISPMDFGDAHKIVARNFREFLNLAWTMRGATDLANVHGKRTKEEYVELFKYFEDSVAESDTNFEKSRAHVLKCMQQKLVVQAVDDVFDYIENEVRAARAQQIVLKTQDGIGIVGGEQQEGSAPRNFPVTQDDPIDPEQLAAFLEVSSKEGKLALIRDVQFTGHFTFYSEFDEVIPTILKEHGLEYELKMYREIRSMG